MPRRFRSNPDARPRYLWLWWLLGVVGVAAFLTLGYLRLPQRFRSDLSRRDAALALEKMARGDWGTAGKLVARARHFHPSEPSVIRAVADWQILTGAHPERIISELRQLVERRIANDDDILKIARAYRQLGFLEVAAGWLDRLSPTGRAQIEVIEFETALLNDAGQTVEAERRLRLMLEQHLSEPGVPFKMAVLDYAQALSPIRERGRVALFEVAREGGDRSAIALDLLTKDPALTTAEATELMRLASKQVHRGVTLRYAAMTALLKVMPDADRLPLVMREAKSTENLNDEGRLAFANAAAAGLPIASLLSWVDGELRKREQPLLRELLQLRLDASARLGRWQDVRAILATRVVENLGRVPVSLWRACADAHLEPSLERSRQHLKLAIAASSSPLNQTDLVHCGDTAMRLGIWDIAASVFALAASDTSILPPEQILRLERAEEALERAGETAALLSTARRIAVNPASRAHHVFRADYMALLAGEPIEPVVARLVGVAGELEPTARLKHHLLWSMVFQRRGQVEPLKKELQSISINDLKSDLPPGPRAVLAGLFASVGEATSANQLSQGVPPTMLLPEEKAWLALVK